MDKPIIIDNNKNSKYIKKKVYNIKQLTAETYSINTPASLESCDTNISMINQLLNKSNNWAKLYHIFIFLIVISPLFGLVFVFVLVKVLVLVKLILVLLVLILSLLGILLLILILLLLLNRFVLALVFVNVLTWLKVG